ncbi:Guanosine-diphosphatase [Mycoemilia scoparia]|uniref:guanosine-diphosphatase n=1 Tax=Mycoemilia scoparia TaxID=417184 RepID=A0A9W8A487_9FUNG|nr:Guanosine-diphosphatase [Mycoemilia scoparia]
MHCIQIQRRPFSLETEFSNSGPDHGSNEDQLYLEQKEYKVSTHNNTANSATLTPGLSDSPQLNSKVASDFENDSEIEETSRETTVTPTTTLENTTKEERMGFLSNFIDSIRNGDGTKYSGLGSYPNRNGTQGPSVGFFGKRVIRIGILVIIALTLGWLAISSTMSITDSENKVYQDNTGKQQDKENVAQPPKFDNYNKNFDVEVQEDPRMISKHCDVPHPGRPLVQYVIIIDAGSTGSRIHVYKFNYCKNYPELEDEAFEMLKPGLSSYPDDPVAAAKSLDVLLDKAMSSIPPILRKCSPVAVKATAGLRLLGDEKSDSILEAVRHHLNNNYPFPVTKENGVIVMDGQDEGVYSWITVNSLLGTLGKDEHLTAGTFDMGGGSTQIVFEPLYRSGNDTIPASIPKDYLSNLSISDQKHNLYQHSYLGYGLNSATKQIFQAIGSKALESGQNTASSPCFSPGFSKEVTVNSLPVLVKGADPSTPLKPESNYEECASVVKSILHKERGCISPPCSFDGVSQPPLAQTFDKQPFYIFSYFYDISYPFGLGEEFTPNDLKSLAQKLCKHDGSVTIPETAEQDFGGTDHLCLYSTYLASVLLDGVEMPGDRKVRTTREINGYQTGWCLGAALAVLDQHRYCDGS